jgi:hypothetical protein
MIPPIRIHRASPSPDFKAKFVAQPDFEERIHEFLSEIGSNFPRPPQEQARQEREVSAERVSIPSSPAFRIEPENLLGDEPPISPTEPARPSPQLLNENLLSRSRIPRTRRQKTKCTFGPKHRTQTGAAATQNTSLPSDSQDEEPGTNTRNVAGWGPPHRRGKKGPD